MSADGQRHEARMKWIIFHSVLKPLILANYWLREHGFATDEWFWADELALRWGFGVV